MNYQDTTEYLLNIPKFTGKHTVEDTRAFYKVLIPDFKETKIIHVAGTNGKGSVCAYLRSVLRTMGYTVGLFTSPHLVKINERIRFEDEDITDGELCLYFDKVMEHLTPGGYHPSFFEYLFFMGMLFFYDKKPDFLILETGLGGKLDATNVIDDPELNVITRIGFDHMAYLGNTIESIAGEKAGIFRAGVPVVFDALVPDAKKVMEREAKRLDCPMYPVTKEDFCEESLGNKNIDFCYSSRYYRSVKLSMGSIALYQMENASVALRAAEVLFSEAEITPEIMQKAVKDTYWKARMDEIIPGVYIDGAHNEDGIDAFIKSVEANKCEGKRSLVFGVVKDKDYEGMVRDLAGSGLFESVRLVPVGGSRELDLGILQELFARFGQENVSTFKAASEAYDDAIKSKTEKDEVYIAGSLYLAGDVLGYLGL